MTGTHIHSTFRGYVGRDEDLDSGALIVAEVHKTLGYLHTHNIYITGGYWQFMYRSFHLAGVC